jgi:hypothetical protein
LNSKDPWATLYTQLSDPLYASLVSEETSELALNIMEAFIRSRGSSITETFPSLLASIVYLHVSGHRKPRERLMKWVLRWARNEFGASGVSGKDTENMISAGGVVGGYSKLKLLGVGCEDLVMKESDCKAVTRGMKDVLRNFTAGFPSIFNGSVDSEGKLYSSAIAAE